MMLNTLTEFQKNHPTAAAISEAALFFGSLACFWYAAPIAAAASLATGIEISTVLVKAVSAVTALTESAAIGAHLAGIPQTPVAPDLNTDLTNIDRVNPQEDPLSQNANALLNQHRENLSQIRNRLRNILDEQQNPNVVADHQP